MATVDEDRGDEGSERGDAQDQDSGQEPTGAFFLLAEQSVEAAIVLGERLGDLCQGGGL